MYSFVKIITVFAVISFFTAVWYKNEFERVNNLYNILQGNNSLLIEKIKDIYNEKLEVDKRNVKLEQAAETENKKFFNWYADISNSPVIKQLQAN